MFKKPFKLKSQVQLKSSEKKKFGIELKKYFPQVTEEEINVVFNSKDDIIKSKILTHSEENVEVYYVDKVPMFFDIVDSNLRVPTVFCLWKLPSLVPLFTTNNFVFDKLKKGADLFLPGVFMEGLVFNEKTFVKNDIAAINLVDNKSCVAVGQALLSQHDLQDTSRNGGKVLKILHIYGDFLYKTHTGSVLPEGGQPDWIQCLEESSTPMIEQEESESLQEAPTESSNAAEVEQSEPTMESLTEVLQEISESDRMNQILENAFLKAIKTNSKNIFPILAASFYAAHILTNLPENENLNIKKTKWKKFSSFLQDMSTLGVITIEEIKKNEFRITGANVSHPKVRQFVCDNVKKVEEKVSSNGQPVVQQIHLVSALVLPFFEKFGCKKKDELTKNDIRNHLNEYIRANNLQHPTVKDQVVLDALLYGIVKEEHLSRGDLISALVSKMGVEHKISNLPSGTVVLKGKMPLIEFEVVTRSGNKKVTLINNLESYGVDVNSFSKDLQHTAAASTSLTPNVPGKKGTQVQVQGNQIHIAVRILNDKFNIHSKHMRGLDKAIKNKRS